MTDSIFETKAEPSSFDWWENDNEPSNTTNSLPLRYELQRLRDQYHHTQQPQRNEEDATQQPVDLTEDGLDEAFVTLINEIIEDTSPDGTIPLHGFQGDAEYFLDENHFEENHRVLTPPQEEDMSSDEGSVDYDYAPTFLEYLKSYVKELLSTGGSTATHIGLATKKFLPGKYIATFKQSLDDYETAEKNLNEAKQALQKAKVKTKTLRGTHLRLAKLELAELDRYCSIISTPHLLGNSSRAEHSERNLSLPKRRQLMASKLDNLISKNMNAERVARLIEDSQLIQQAAVLLTQKIWLYAKRHKISHEGFDHKAWEDYLCMATDTNALQAEDCPDILRAVGMGGKDMTPPLLPSEIEGQLEIIGFNPEQAKKVRRICRTLIRAKTPCQELITNVTPYSEAIVIQAEHMADKLKEDVDFWIDTERFTETMDDIGDILTLTANRLGNSDISSTHVEAISLAIVGKINLYLNKVLGFEGTRLTKNIEDWGDHITTAIIGQSSKIPTAISNAIEDMRSSNFGMTPELNKKQAGHITKFLTAFLQSFQELNRENSASTMVNSSFFDQLGKAIKTRSPRFQDSMAGIAEKLRIPMQAYLIQQRAQQYQAKNIVSLDRNLAEDIKLILQKIKNDQHHLITVNDAERLREFQRTTNWFPANQCDQIIAVDYLDSSQYKGEKLPEGLWDLGIKRQQLADALASYSENISEHNFQAIINKLDDTTKETHTEAENSLKAESENLKAAQQNFDGAKERMNEAKEMAHQIKLLLVNAILQYITSSSFGVFCLHGKSSLTIACNALRELITVDDPLAIMTAAQGLLIRLDTYNQGSLAAYIDNSATAAPDSSNTGTDATNSLFYHDASFNTVNNKVKQRFKRNFRSDSQFKHHWHDQIDDLKSASGNTSAAEVGDDTTTHAQSAEMNSDHTNCVTQTLQKFMSGDINDEQLTDQLQLQQTSVKTATQKNYMKQTSVLEAIGNHFSLFRTEASKKMQGRITTMGTQISVQIGRLSKPRT